MPPKSRKKSTAVRRASPRAAPLPAPAPPPVQPAVAPPRAAAAPTPVAPPGAEQEDAVARLLHVMESLVAARRSLGPEPPPPSPTPAAAIAAAAPLGGLGGPFLGAAPAATATAPAPDTPRLQPRRRRLRVRRPPVRPAVQRCHPPSRRWGHSDRAAGVGLTKALIAYMDDLGITTSSGSTCSPRPSTSASRRGGCASSRQLSPRRSPGRLGCEFCSFGLISC